MSNNQNKSKLADEYFWEDAPEDKGLGASLSLTRAPTVLLTFAANRFTRSTSAHFAKMFGIGAMDWRALVMLKLYPGASVAQTEKLIGIDKAAVSRCFAKLSDKKLVTGRSEGTDERRKSWYLTDKGHDLHDSVLPESTRRLHKLLDGFSADEIETLNQSLSRILSNLDKLNAEKYG